LLGVGVRLCPARNPPSARSALPSGPFQAARALIAGDASRAAAIYDTHGAARSAALARLRSGDPAELRRALEFFTRVGATRYARECEQSLVTAR
jgi:hypothetical protein